LATNFHIQICIEIRSTFDFPLQIVLDKSAIRIKIDLNSRYKKQLP